VGAGAVLLQTQSTPTGSSFAGSLVAAGSVHGTAVLTFVAGDSGPGIYQVTVKVDGKPVYQGTPNTNGGQCVSHGTDSSSGALVFDSQQPCPPSDAVDITVDTTQLVDGQHRVQAIVEDGAQDAATVLDQTITTNNLSTPAGTSSENLPPPPSSAANPAAGYAFKLDTATTAMTTRTVERRYDDSAITLSGTVVDSAGAPVPGATVSVQSAPLTAVGFTTIANVTANAAGRFELTVPRGDSRDLRLTGANGQVTITERVTPNIALRVRALRHARLLFTGEIGIDSAGAPPPQVTVETLTPHGTFPIATVTAKHGRFRYVYQASTLAIGSTYALRAVTPAGALWQGGASQVRRAKVHR
jgi:hypothetical protein